MTVVLFQAKFNVPEGMLPLDSFEGPPDGKPSASFVVSRDRDGALRSVYGDLMWDLSAYGNGRSQKLFFAYWGKAEATPERIARSFEARGVVFSLIWKRDGAPLSSGTLINYVGVLCAVCQYAEDKGTTMETVLGDEAALRDFVLTRCGGWMAETLGSLLTSLDRIGHAALGFPVVSSSTIKALHKRAKAYRDTLKQHAPMPTRIYSQFIRGLIGELDEWQEVASEMLALLARCGADRFTGRSHAQQNRVARESGVSSPIMPTFEELATPKCLAYLRARGKEAHVKSLSYVVAEMQVVTKLIIQTYSGMRDDEAGLLPYDCLDQSTVDGKRYHLVKGATTKLNGGRIKRTRWVTNHDGHRALRAARDIADTIYGVLDVQPDKRDESASELPLFVSTGYMKLAVGPLNVGDGRFQAGTMTIREDSRLWELLPAIIEEQDLRELEHIDPHRAWRTEEKYALGARWPFTTHQLRRSLALYAQRSGLVSLPSLRRQLQHLTEAMSRYYARGSSFAKDFLGEEEKDHFGNEWQATQPESAGLSYILNVLLTDDKLFGGHAHWAEHRLKAPDGTLLLNRQVTMRRFAKGELAYRETLIGGCTNTTSCDKPAVNWLDTDCLRDDCRNLVCSLPKLNRVIAAQERMVSELDPTSVEYRTEKADLEVLTTARDAALQA